MGIDSLGNSGLGPAGLTGGGLTGRGLAGGGGEGPLSLEEPDDLYGRQGVAVPAGVKLPRARGGKPPYAYTLTSAPAGTSFAAATRILEGTPTASGDNTVTYRVEDAEGAAISHTFDWNILGLLANDGIQLQDFDGGKYGYGVSAFRPQFAMTLVSGADPSAVADTNFWQRVPRTVIGSIVDDPFALPEIPNAGIISRLRHRANTNPVRWYLYSSPQNAMGQGVVTVMRDWIDANPDAVIYVQRALAVVGLTIPFNEVVWRGGDSARWDLDAVESAWCIANLADGDQFIIVVA